MKVKVKLDPVSNKDYMTTSTGYIIGKDDFVEVDDADRQVNYILMRDDVIIQDEDKMTEQNQDTTPLEQTFSEEEPVTETSTNDEGSSEDKVSEKEETSEDKQYKFDEGSVSETIKDNDLGGFENGRP